MFKRLKSYINRRRIKKLKAAQLVFLCSIVAYSASCTHKPVPLKDRIILDLHTNTYRVIPERCYIAGEFSEALCDVRSL